MQITLKRNFFQVIGITLVALCSILIAFGFERILIRYTTISPETAKLIFSIVLPVVLLILQRPLMLFLNSAFIRGGVPIVSSKPPQFDELAQKAITSVQESIGNYLGKQYNISNYTLAILDWKSKQYISIVGNAVTLPHNHALVYFARQYHAVFCTERRSQLVDELPDAIHGEMYVFMSKHHYAFAIPLFTEQAVYGFIFLEQRAVMNSKLYATNNFSELEKFGRAIGPLLHQTIIYQSIVRGQ